MGLVAQSDAGEATDRVHGRRVLGVKSPSASGRTFQNSDGLPAARGALDLISPLPSPGVRATAWTGSVHGRRYLRGGSEARALRRRPEDDDWLSPMAEADSRRRSTTARTDHLSRMR